MEIEKIIQELNKEEELYDYIVINDSNVILVLERDGYFLLVHEKIEDNKLVRKYTWTQESYTKELNHNDNIIKEDNLLLVEGNNFKYDSVYNYNKSRFIVRKGTFDEVEKQSSQLHSFIGKFSICDENYYALIDKKGKIRKSLIYKGDGNTYSGIINIQNFGSIEVFKLLVTESHKERKKH